VTSTEPFTVSVTNLLNSRRPFAAITVNNSTISITAPPAQTTSTRSFTLLVASGAHTRSIAVEQPGLPILNITLETQPQETCTDAVYINN
jgi:hypothetical protein